MASLTQLYQITDGSLAQRRRFIGLDDEVVALLGAVAPWANEVGPRIAGRLTEHHFGFSATAQFFRDNAAARGIPIDQLRAGWQKAQESHWQEIFAEPAQQDPFGRRYFEQLLGVGTVHNRHGVPLKWYIGAYLPYMDAVREQLREDPPIVEAAPSRRTGRGIGRGRGRGEQVIDPELAAAVERAISVVLNYDLQAVCDAFHFDTFTTLGLDLESLRTANAGRDQDLSDRGSELKGAVRESLALFVDSSRSMHEMFGQVRGNVDQTASAIDGIAAASAEVARGSERQAEMLQRSRELSDQVTEATARAREVGTAGAQAVSSANDVMEQVRVSGQQAQAAIQELAQKSSEIGGILDTIAGIAEQTNLLALNAAIEAARAGEHGRGFAVVAEEVRKLAEESAGSASTIGELVLGIQRGIETVVALVSQAAEMAEQGVSSSESAQHAFEEIGEAIGSISERVAGIADASAEVASVAEQSSASAQAMSSATEQTSAQSQEISSSLSHLADTADRLMVASERFELARG
ncbi:MAG: methyl-accepting chemotaxis protein [Solirubrobacteraceae bacterium]